MLEGVSGCGSPRADAEFGEDVAHVTVHGPLAEDQFGSYRPVGPTRSDHSEDFDLTTTQPTGVDRMITDDRFRPDHVGARAEQSESVPRGRQLQGRAVVVLHRATGLTDVDPHTSRFVGDFEVVPQPVGPTQDRQRLVGPAFGQVNGAAGVCRSGVQGRRLALLCDLRELGGALVSRHQVPADNHDLHVCRQQL